MMVPVGGGRRYRHPDSGSIVKQFFALSKYKPDPRMNILLHVGYILGQMPVGEQRAAIPVTDDITLLLERIDSEDGTTIYSVQECMEDVATTVFLAEYGADRSLTFDDVPEGTWSYALELAYALVRDDSIMKIGSGA